MFSEGRILTGLLAVGHAEMLAADADFAAEVDFRAAIAADVGAESAAELFDVRAQEVGVGYAPYIVFAEDGRPRRTELLSEGGRRGEGRWGKSRGTRRRRRRGGLWQKQGWHGRRKWLATRVRQEIL